MSAFTWVFILLFFSVDCLGQSDASIGLDSAEFLLPILLEFWPLIFSAESSVLKSPSFVGFATFDAPVMLSTTCKNVSPFSIRISSTFASLKSFRLGIFGFVDASADFSFSEIWLPILVVIWPFGLNIESILFPWEYRKLKDFSQVFSRAFSPLPIVFFAKEWKINSFYSQLALFMMREC